MTIEVSPARIEQSDLSGGYWPDPAEAAVAISASPESRNLLPMPFGNELRMRHGFTRETAGRVSALSASHYIRALDYYEVVNSGERKRYIMAVFSNGTNASSNNIRIYAYDLDLGTFTRVDTAAVSWPKARWDWWFATIEGTWYACTRGSTPVSWHPADGYNADPMTPTGTDTWVDSISPSAGQVARDKAFKKGDMVLYSGTYYRTVRGIRYKSWESGQGYSRGEKVSRKTAIGGYTYWRSYECISSHTAGSTNAPGTGADTATYWKARRLSNILDDDSVLTDDWSINPIPEKTGVGAYHGGRLFVKAGNTKDRHSMLVQYSAPAKPKRGDDFNDLVWNATDWAPQDDIDGDGGGWFPVPFGGKGDGIRAMKSFGNYLLIYGRWQTYVLSGLNETTWTLRHLGNYGALSNGSVCELDGLVYSISRQGILTRTDGTTIEPVPGMEPIRKWLKDKIDDVLNTGGDETDAAGDQNWFVRMVAHDGFLWIALPVPSGNRTTLVYDPRTESFWEVDLPILGLCVGEAKGVERMWFSAPITGAATEVPTLFRYTDDPGSEAYTDDDWQAVSGSASTSDIAWYHRTAWFQFGTTRNERRIRRIWALVGGEAAQSVVVRMYKNFVDATGSYVTTVTRTLTGQTTQQAEFVEGSVANTDAHAVAIRLSGSANAQTSVHGVGIDTEHRRTRFHT